MAGYNLKKPEEVKEYLHNLHIEYKFGCYNEKNPETCHLLADFTEAVKKDFKKAGLLYKANCDERNYGKSCTKYGDYKLIGKGCTEDHMEAYKYMVRGCELNDPKGCHHAGSIGVAENKHISEKERAIRVPAGMTMLTKACDGGVEKACFLLSGIYLTGIEGYVEKNLREAYKLSLKCCEIGNPYACANVSQMHARGDGVQKNHDLAETFKKRALDLHSQISQQRKQLKFHQGI